MCQITIFTFSTQRGKVEDSDIAHFFDETTKLKNFLRLNRLYPRKMKKPSLELLQQERFCTMSEKKHLKKIKLVICHLSDQCALWSCTGPTMT